jgi:ribonucleoside-diphosphate reductase alpha chain
MYRAAWHAGLKTTYYLRTLQASNIEKATVSVKKEVRGHAGAVAEPAGAYGTSVAISDQPSAVSSMELSAEGREPGAGGATRTYTAAEKTACSIEAMRRGETCEACQ